MKTKNGLPESNNNENKWSFIKKSQEIIERKKNQQAPEDTDDTLDQSDNLSELDPDTKESVISTGLRP
jgi:hypothetical protein